MRGKEVPDVTVNLKNQIAQFLLANSTNHVVNYGKIAEAAGKFGVSKRTIHNIWSAAKFQINGGIPVQLKSNKLGISHKKKMVIPIQAIKDIPLQKRGTIRKLAVELSISKSSVGRWVRSEEIRAPPSAIKPQLTDHNKLQRLSFSLKAIQVQHGDMNLKYSDMYDVVHIDEKWFYMARECERYYMLPEETDSYRACKSKRFISKIMFMCVVARPRDLVDGQYVFDGKIGLWPFTKQEQAARNSKHRLRGTLVTKHIDSITKEVIKSCIINQVIPAIKAKWPPYANKNIWIQQDNAKPHILNDDPDFRAAASADGFNIQIVCQPPNSPDNNINDLGWFRAIQSLQVETARYTIDQLVHNVLLSFKSLSAITLNKVFVSLKCCLTEIMKVQGHNNYKIPHISKDRLIREDILPISLEVDLDLVMAALQFLTEVGHPNGVTYDIGELGRLLGF